MYRCPEDQRLEACFKGERCCNCSRCRLLASASRAEALLRLHKLGEADEAISGAFRLETLCPSCLQTKFFIMLANSYMYMVRAKVEMVFGRFNNAVAAAEKARQIDPGSAEVTATLRNVRYVANSQAKGNKLFNSGKFVEACLAYGEGLKLDASNPVLYYNRVACRSKLGQWEWSVDDCNEALKIQPNYIKALLRHASSSGKLEGWAESVQDYEILRKELSGDADVAEALLHAQLALKTSRGEVSTLKLGGEVEKVTAPGQFQAAISTPELVGLFVSESRGLVKLVEAKGKRHGYFLHRFYCPKRHAYALYEGIARFAI